MNRERLTQLLTALKEPQPEWMEGFSLFRTTEVFWEGYYEKWYAFNPIGMIMWPGPWSKTKDRLKWIAVDSMTFPEGYSFCFPEYKAAGNEAIMSFFGLNEEDARSLCLLTDMWDVNETMCGAGLWHDRTSFWNPSVTPALITVESFEKWKEGKREWVTDEVVANLEALLG